MQRIAMLSGSRFGRLVVISESTVRTKYRYFGCLCDCGNSASVRGDYLRSGKTKSCGCIARETTAARNLRHGHTVGGKLSGAFNSWRGIIERCLNRTGKMYENYGGRGITVCDRWMTFESFLSDMGERPLGCSIDRIDNNGNYEPGNCRWATPSQQSSNTRRSRLITFNGETLNIGVWAKRFGRNPRSLRASLKRRNGDVNAVFGACCGIASADT